MHYRSGNGRRCCIGAGRHCVCTHQATALFFVKWRHGCLNRHAFNWRTILPNFVPTWFEMTGPIGFLEEGCLNRKKNEMSSDMGSVPDPKKLTQMEHVYHTTHLVSLRDSLEFLLCFWVVPVHIGMILLCQLQCIDNHIIFMFVYHYDSIQMFELY